MTTMTMPVLETDHLLIRPLAMEDAAAVRRIFEIEAETDAERRENRERWLSTWLQWNTLNHRVLASLDQPPYGERAVVLKVTGEVVGLCGLVPSFGPFGQLGGSGPARNTPEVGLFYWFAPEQRGNGYATEAASALIRFAFDSLNVHRIIATTERDNAASQAVMRKLDMRLEHNPRPEPPWFQVVGVLDHP